MTEDAADIDGAALLRDPSLFLRGVDFAAGEATLSPMTEDSYARATALDGAMETAGPDRTVPIAALDSAVIAADPLRRPMSFIIQHEFSGAAMLSQVLAQPGGLHCVREPAILGMLGREARRIGGPDAAMTEDQWRWANTLNLHMMARSWRDADVTLVTAPAHCTEISPGLLGWSARCRAILLYVELQPFIGAALRDEGWTQLGTDIAAFYHQDFVDMVGDEAPKLAEMSRAQQAAMVWLIHGTEYRRMADSKDYEGRVLAVDFDSVLARPEQALAQIRSFLEKPITIAAAEALCTQDGALMRFSNAGDPVYSTARRALLEESLNRHADEARAAIDWAEGWAARLGL